MKIIKFTIYGEPTAKARAKTRFVQPKNGSKPFAQTYTPAKTRNAEEDIRTQAVNALQQSGGLNGLTEAPLVLTVKIYRSIPKSFSKAKRILAVNGQLRPTARPDTDNYIKTVKDALNSVIWKDDSQVVEYGAGTGKYYAEQPRVEVEVWELTQGLPVVKESELF